MGHNFTLSRPTLRLSPYLGVLNTVSYPTAGGVWTEWGSQDAPVPDAGASHTISPYLVPHCVHVYHIFVYLLLCVVYSTLCLVLQQEGFGRNGAVKTLPCLTPGECRSLRDFMDEGEVTQDK